MISPTRLLQLRSIIQSGEAARFYDWPEWDSLRNQVLELDHWECQLCRRNHRYRRAALVHHVRHLKDRPDLALSIYDPETAERQLLSVCRPCHEALHPERQRKRILKCAQPLTAERWD